MSKEEEVKDWQRIYDSLHDPELRDERRRKANLKKRAEEKVSDTGL